MFKNYFYLRTLLQKVNKIVRVKHLTQSLHGVKKVIDKH